MGNCQEHPNSACHPVNTQRRHTLFLSSEPHHVPGAFLGKQRMYRLQATGAPCLGNLSFVSLSLSCLSARRDASGGGQAVGDQTIFAGGWLTCLSLNNSTDSHNITCRLETVNTYRQTRTLSAKERQTERERSSERSDCDSSAFFGLCPDFCFAGNGAFILNA